MNAEASKEQYIFDVGIQARIFVCISEANDHVLLLSETKRRVVHENKKWRERERERGEQKVIEEVR